MDLESPKGRAVGYIWGRAEMMRVSAQMWAVSPNEMQFQTEEKERKWTKYNRFSPCTPCVDGGIPIMMDYLFSWVMSQNEPYFLELPLSGSLTVAPRWRTDAQSQDWEWYRCWEKLEHFIWKIFAIGLWNRYGRVWSCELKKLPGPVSGASGPLLGTPEREGQCPSAQVLRFPEGK